MKASPPLIRKSLGYTQDAINRLLRPQKRRFGRAVIAQPQKTMAKFAKKVLSRYKGRRTPNFEKYVDFSTGKGSYIHVIITYFE